MKRLAVKLKPKAEKAIKQGHPWIYQNAIVKISEGGIAGDVCVVYDQRKNRMMALGLYDPHSPIRIKVLHVGEPATLDSTFFEGRLRSALELRHDLLETDTNSFRWINGENDGMPGLIVDVYDRVAVVKIYSLIWQGYLDMLYSLIAKLLPLDCIVQRVSRAVAEQGSLADGEVVHGELLDPVVVFREHGVRFSAHVIKGHKTGYFLDHRENRRLVGTMARHKRVLDVFSYAGGFSVHAAVGGARSVTSIDISRQALEVAAFNMSLNEHHADHKTMAMDAFEALSQLIAAGEVFELVVVDPPSFAKKAEEVPDALKSYTRLAKMAAQLVRKGGDLVLASCTARVGEDAFFAACAKGIAASGRRLKLLKKTGHDIDHPVTFREGRYLKCGYYGF